MTYSDFKINLDAHPIRRDLVLDNDEAAIRRSIKNILFIQAGELPYDKLDFGTGLPQYLFENITPVFETLISDEIVRSIKAYEPRVSNVKATVKVNPDQNAYDATIYYRPINSTNTLSLNVILERVR